MTLRKISTPFWIAALMKTSKEFLNLDMGLSFRKGNHEYFYRKLDEVFPGLKDIYVEEFGDREFIHGKNDPKLKGIFKKQMRKTGDVVQTRTIYLIMFMNFHPKLFNLN